MTEEDIEALRKKLARATNAVHAVTKDSAANMGDKIGTINYASIGTVLTHIKAALQGEGLALNQPFGYVPVDGGLPIMTVDTLITDTATGHFIGFQGPGFPVKADPQAAAGGITYFRRYALVSLFGLIVEDDDGQQATRIERQPTNRTDDEAEMRVIIGNMDADIRAAFIADFKDQFGSGLADLDTNRHIEALSYTKNWITE